MDEMTGHQIGVAKKTESHAMIKRANELLKASIKYQEDNNRLKTWKRLEQKLRGKYYPNDPERRRVETIASYVYETINAVAPRQPYIRISARTPEYVTANGIKVDNVRNARFREGAINQEFSNIKIHKQIKKGLRDAFCPYGYGVWKIGWGANTVYDEQGQEQVEEEGFWVKRHCARDCIPQVFSTDPDDMPGIFWRIWMPLNKAKAEAEKRGWNMDVLENITGDTIPKFLYSDQRKDYSAEIKMVELFEWHNIEEDYIATFIKDGSDFLEMPKDNPYLFKGMHGAIYIPWSLNDEFYGRSQAELIEGQADDINESREQVRSHVKAFPFLLIDYSPDASKNDMAYKYAPYGCKVNMPSGKPGDLVVHGAPALNRDVYMWGDQARSDSQWVLAKSDMSHGQADPRQKATQSSIIAGKENVMNLGMQDDIAEIYEILAAKAGDLLVQNITGERWFRYQGEIQGDQTAPFESYGFMDIIGDFDHKVDIESLSPVNNEVKAQTMINIVTQALDPKMGQLGAGLQRQYKMEEVIKKALKLQDVDLEEFRRPPEENPKKNSPYDENMHALSGGLIDDPQPGEEWHIPIHKAVAMATKDEEISRHTLKHEAMAANSPQGVQQAMMAQQQGMPQGGMPQGRPLPTMQGAPQPSGGATAAAQIPPGVQQQMNPMVR